MHVEKPLSCTCPPLSHVRSPIGTEHYFSVVKISLHQRFRLPSAFTVNHDLEGATFRRWLPLDRPLQGGPHPAVGVEQALVGRVPRIDTDEDGPLGLDGNRRLEREVA